MFDTNDVYNDAVRGSTMYENDNSDFGKSSIGSNMVGTLLFVGIAYVGFNYYSVTNSVSISNLDQALIVKNELVAEIQEKAEVLVKPKLEMVAQINDSEAEYLSALRSIESELTEEREDVNLETNTQMDLSLAMNALMDDTLLSDNTKYTKELRKEIGVELNEAVESSSVVADVSVPKDSRTVIVKKGDTLQSISDKFYGDAMNYKRIIASNASLNYNDTTIYEGQTILLPY